MSSGPGCGSTGKRVCLAELAGVGVGRKEQILMEAHCGLPCGQAGAAPATFTACHEMVSGSDREAGKTLNLSMKTQMK